MHQPLSSMNCLRKPDSEKACPARSTTILLYGLLLVLDTSWTKEWGLRYTATLPSTTSASSRYDMRRSPSSLLLPVAARTSSSDT